MSGIKGLGQALLNDTSKYFFITLSVVIFILIILFGWIYDRIGLKDRSCSKLDIYYTTLTNKSYFNNGDSLRNSTIFDISDSILINYYVKSAYNCCCGDGYKNNFVALCALEKCIKNGCRFLDFEIYSYNNEPIVASSTADNNYIKETYNSLSLEEVLNTITDHAFDATKTTCANDPIILNFRVMSTNLGMLEKIGELFERILDKTNDSNVKLLKQYNYENKDGSILYIKMKELYRKIIISFDFNPNPSIVDQPKLTKLKSYINLLKGTNSHIYRYNHIIAKGTTFSEDTKKKYVIVLPNLDNSTQNFDSTISHNHGCQAICMKHQNLDNNLLGYNALFKNNENYSWKIKAPTLLNSSPVELVTTTGNSILPNSGGTASNWLSEEEGRKKPLCGIYSGTVLAKCGTKTVNIWGKGAGGDSLENVKNNCNTAADRGIRNVGGVDKEIGYWGTCAEIAEQYKEFKAGNNINIGHLGGIELNSGHLSKMLETSKPKCEAYRGSIWAKCGDRTISKWDIGSGDTAEKARGDCDTAANNGSRIVQGVTIDGRWGTCKQLFDNTKYKDKLTYRTGINIATYGGPDLKPE